MIHDSKLGKMGSSTIIDYHALFDHGFKMTENVVNIEGHDQGSETLCGNTVCEIKYLSYSNVMCKKLSSRFNTV